MCLYAHMGHIPKEKYHNVHIGYLGGIRVLGHGILFRRELLRLISIFSDIHLIMCVIKFLKIIIHLNF